MSNTVEEYYTFVMAFCKYLEQTTITEGELDSLITHLMTLYSKTIALPDVEPDNELANDRKHRDNAHWLHIDVADGYYHLFDPFVCEDAVGGNLYDDLSDIYEDVMDGIYEYEKGNINNAVWEWKFGLDEHWGRHLTHAISALHALR